jgi:hypothetical protein
MVEARSTSAPVVVVGVVAEHVRQSLLDGQIARAGKRSVEFED